LGEESLPDSHRCVRAALLSLHHWYAYETMKAMISIEAHLAAAADSRYQEQCRMGAHFRSPVEHHMARSFLSTHPTSGRVARNGSSMTSSPVTSVSDEHTGERWISSPIRRDARGRRFVANERNKRSANEHHQELGCR
uniref:Ras-GEF domain-containing protein n=1 Tax=Heligmosomoides polygyrus TaxID=6339 RepID=A0A183GVS0_HELPZ